MKISIVTVVFNAQDTIAKCIESVISQKYPDIEFIIIDGGSKDNTLQVIDKYRASVRILVSEPDEGIYDAMNKGIKMATGDVVGTLNADDQLAGDDIISAVALAFKTSDADAVYGNLNIINQVGDIIRKWTSKQCRENSFNRGFMPPHPTFYCKRKLFDMLGFYSLEYGSAADYELILRFMYLHKLKSYHLNKLMVNMLSGGVSNRSFKNRLKAWNFDLTAMRNNSIKFPIIALALKPLRKLYQYF